MAAQYRKLVEEAVDSRSHRLHQLNHFLWQNPEVGFEEVKAHDYITSYLESEGFSVERNYYLPTAFRAEYKVGNGPVVFLLCEYDALPELGHACGHNLIAESAVGAGVAVKRVLDDDPALNGTVVVLGTPAEEGGCGKELLIRKGAFKGADVALMAHPENRSALRVRLSARSTMSAKFRGKAAHAAQSPWDGVNALDAAVGAYVNVAMLRQQLKPTWRVHGIFIKAGSRVNVIPEESDVRYSVRAQTAAEVALLKQKVEACLRSAADATGCSVQVSTGIDTKNVVHNELMIQSFQKHAEFYDFRFIDGDHPIDVPSGASTDAGNVSHVVPCIHPVYKINTLGKNHTREFQKAAGTPEAHRVALNVAKALALTALDIIMDADLLHRVRQEFRESFDGETHDISANGFIRESEK